MSVPLLDSPVDVSGVSVPVCHLPRFVTTVGLTSGFSMNP